MGKRREGGKAGQRGSSSSAGSRAQSQIPPSIRETPFAGPVPRFEIPGWRARFGVVAGITNRGEEPGRDFDLGLWSRAPVGEVMNRWLAFHRALPEFPTVVLGNQVHGVELKQVDEGVGWIQVQGIDGWITTKPGILLTVTVADCIPVYLIAPGCGVALLHAGWRGTAGGIVKRGIEGLARATKTPASRLVMHCGVGICGPCYEVGSEFVQACGLQVQGDGPWHLDLRDQLVDQGRQAGIRQITVSSWCSAHDRPIFFSHRASQGGDGRMVAYIGMTAG